MAKKKFKLWAIFSEEEKPIAVSYAKTRGGALRNYEQRSGHTRFGLHVEEMDFEKGCFLYICST